MTNERLDKLESNFYEQQKVLGMIQGTVKNIERYMADAVSIKEDVITQKEKHKVTENRLTKIEDEMKIQDKSINGIHLKIAMFSGGWAVIVYFISKL